MSSGSVRLLEREMVRVMTELEHCDCFVAIGTSGVVEPVASFVRQLKQRKRAEGRKVPAIYVGPEKPTNADCFDEFYLGTAAEMMPKMLEQL